MVCGFDKDGTDTVKDNYCDGSPYIDIDCDPMIYVTPSTSTSEGEKANDDDLGKTLVITLRKDFGCTNRRGVGVVLVENPCQMGCGSSSANMNHY